MNYVYEMKIYGLYEFFFFEVKYEEVVAIFLFALGSFAGREQIKLYEN